MGYDMDTVNERGRSVDDCDDPEHGEHYWRRSIFGGGPQAQRLVDVGMAYWPREGNTVPGDYPKPKDFDLVHNEDWSGEDDDPQFFGDVDKIAAYELANRNYYRQTYDERPGIAAYKLCHSNDGWWVTQAECASALKLWEAAGEPDVDQGVGDTIPFLRAGAAHDGFRVW